MYGEKTKKNVRKKERKERRKTGGTRKEREAWKKEWGK